MFTQMKRGTSDRRNYVMKARGEQQAQTRQRIVDAIVQLHEEVGPRNTSIKAIAERAGVERLTVYRHFPDENALLQACSACWAERNPPPDPSLWNKIPDPREQTALGLRHLFAYFSRSAAMLTQVHRDLPDIPPLATVTQPFLHYLEQVADGLAQTWKAKGTRRDAVRAVLRHAVRFETWSLLQGAGWDDKAKCDRLVSWVEAVA